MPDLPPPSFSKLAEELIGDLRGLDSTEPARTKRRPTVTLAPLIEQLLQEHRIGRESPEQTIRDHWRELVGPSNAAHSHAARLERNMLTVLSPHSVVRNELFLHRAEIVARIRKLPGCETVKALNLRAG